MSLTYLKRKLLVDIFEETTQNTQRKELENMAGNLRGQIMTSNMTSLRDSRGKGRVDKEKQYLKRLLPKIFQNVERDENIDSISTYSTAKLQILRPVRRF